MHPLMCTRLSAPAHMHMLKCTCLFPTIYRNQPEYRASTILKPEIKYNFQSEPRDGPVDPNDVWCPNVYSNAENRHLDTLWTAVSHVVFTATCVGCSGSPVRLAAFCTCVIRVRYTSNAQAGRIVRVVAKIVYLGSFILHYFDLGF